MSLRYRLTRWAVSRWITPRVLESDAVPAYDKAIYVLANRSVTDIAMLELAASQAGKPLPFIDDQPQYLALNKPTGFWRRQTMRSAPAELDTVLGAEDATHSGTQLVPVVVFWGRAPSREWSFWRSLFSETWSVTGRFKRLLHILINSGDISVSFGKPLPVAEAAAPRQRHRLRHTGAH